MPIHSSELVLFIAFLKNRDYIASTISTYISAIGFVHKLKQMSDPTKEFVVEKILYSIHKDKKCDSRMPITSVKLAQLVKALNDTLSHDYDRILMTAMFTLAYHALLRIGEMAVSNKNFSNVIKRSQLHILDDKLIIDFINFKHSNGRKFQLEILPSADKTICSVLSMGKYLSKRSQKEGPLFLTSIGEPVSRKYFHKILNGALNFCGLSKAFHKPHSFRMGFATDACAKGMSSDKIRSLGRWKSDAYKLYIRESGQISNI